MQTTIEEIEKYKVKLSIEVPPEGFKKDVDNAYRTVAQAVRIPGFRKGKAPKQIIDTQVGREAVVEQFLRDALYTYYMEAVREHDLAPITDPEIDIDVDSVAFDKPLVFTAEIEIRPRLQLEDYKGLRVERPNTDVTDEEVGVYVDRLRDRFAELEPVEHPVTSGDFAVIDLRCTAGDDEVPEATQADFLYEVGTGLLQPKLDEELLGKRAGDIVKFDTELPETFGERSGQEVSFSVLVKDVKSKKLPDADDAFARTASEFDTLEELKADLREKLGEVKGREADAMIRERTVSAVVEKVDVELPERLVDEETEQRLKTATERYARLGVTLEAALEQQGWDEQRFRADARDHAVRAIKADLALESVARQEELEVTAEDLAEEVNSLAQTMGRDAKSTVKALNQAGQMTSLASDIIRAKALDLLVEHAELVPETDVSPSGTVQTSDDEAAASSAEDQGAEG